MIQAYYAESTVKPQSINQSLLFDYL